MSYPGNTAFTGNSLVPSDREHDRHYGNNIKTTRFDVGTGWIDIEADYDGDGRFIELIGVNSDTQATYDVAHAMLGLLGCEWKDILDSGQGE